MSKQYTYIDLLDKKEKLTDLGRLVLKDCYMVVWHNKPQQQADAWFEAVSAFKDLCIERDNEAKRSSDS
jgi:hypothetical protein